jgi:hypothetical protein
MLREGTVSGIEVRGSRAERTRPQKGTPTLRDGAWHCAELTLPAGIWLIEAVATHGKPRAEMSELLPVVAAR